MKATSRQRVKKGIYARLHVLHVIVRRQESRNPHRRLVILTGNQGWSNNIKVH